MRKIGWVYFARAGDSLKIGYSADPEARVKQLQTGCPMEIALAGKIFGSEESEALWHRTFAKYRTTGEWFKADPELLAVVELAMHHDEMHWEELMCADHSRGLAEDHLKFVRGLIHRAVESDIRYVEEWPVKPDTDMRSAGKAKADAFRLERAIARGEPEEGAPPLI